MFLSAVNVESPTHHRHYIHLERETRHWW